MVNDVTYLSVDDIKEMTSISENIDPQFLVPYIRSAEKMHVYDILGIALDSELKGMITGNTLSGVSYTLVQYYIKPLAAWSAYLAAIPFLAFKTTNKGVLRQGSDNSEIPGIPDINWFKQAIKDTQSFFREELLKYLEDNKDSFPAYRSCKKGMGANYSNGIYLGKYD